ncbi:MAG: RIP metalloprotease RseP [Patescibacteria group bacterium]
MFSTIIIFILVLSVLVFVHEFGHFWTARKFGVKAEEFGFGFPPRAFGFYKDMNGKWRKVIGKKEVKDASDTVYSVNWVPLGGFVKIKGENGEGEDEPDSFAGKKPWKRAIILSAGVVMNVVLAAVLFSIGSMMGIPKALDGLPEDISVKDKKIQIIEVLPESPAKEAGFRMGDILVSIEGNRFEDINEIQNYVDSNGDQELTYKIKRGDEMKTFEVTPEEMEGSDRQGVGVALVTTGLVKYPFFTAIWEGIKTTGFLLVGVVVALFGLIKGLVTGAGVGGDVAGPVGIAALTGQMADMGLVYLIQFTALLSVNLAIINFIPFPALDGGRVLFLIIEKFKGSPVKKETEAIFHNIGFALLLLLILIITFKDVANFIFN